MAKSKVLSILPLVVLLLLAVATTVASTIRSEDVKDSEDIHYSFALDQLAPNSLTDMEKFYVEDDAWNMLYPYHESYDSLLVTTTIYNAKYPDAFVTASGKKIDTLSPITHRWIAVSRDLANLGFTFGTKVEISGTGRYDGVWEVQDLMNKRWRKRIDLLIDAELGLGKWHNINIKKLD